LLRSPDAIAAIALDHFVLPNNFPAFPDVARGSDMKCGFLALEAGLT